jgi:hypothetical protein
MHPMLHLGLQDGNKDVFFSFSNVHETFIFDVERSLLRSHERSRHVYPSGQIREETGFLLFHRRVSRKNEEVGSLKMSLTSDLLRVTMPNESAIMPSDVLLVFHCMTV